jgi:hypothetical protein
MGNNNDPTWRNWATATLRCDNREVYTFDYKERIHFLFFNQRRTTSESSRPDKTATDEQPSTSMERVIQDPPYQLDPVIKAGFSRA